MRISDWSSDVCSSDLHVRHFCSLQLRVRRGGSAGRAAPACGRLVSLRRRRQPATDPRPAAAQRLRRQRKDTGGRQMSSRDSARKRVVPGTSVSVRVDLGGRRIITTKISLPPTSPPPIPLSCHHNPYLSYHTPPPPS